MSELYKIMFLVLIMLGIRIQGTSGLSRPSTMRLQNNEFKNVVIAIHESVPEDKALIDTLKDVMTKASQHLHKATRQRAFLEEIKILLPSTWSNDGSYQAPTSETLTFADVIITDPIRGKRSLPLTRSYDGCGKQGIHVLLTKEFLTMPRSEPYFGDPGKYFVHAFAQFRWGVFQEYAEEGENVFYMSANTGRPEPIKCTIAIRGLIQKNDTAHTICYLPAQADPNTGLYVDDCQWRPYPRSQRTKASIMDYQFIQEIETFCDDDHGNYMTEHNYEAPSKHNRLCSHRSTWDIITNTDDFKGGVNPTRGLLDAQLIPTFIIMRATSKRRRSVILVDPDIFPTPADQHQVHRTIAHLRHESSSDDVSLYYPDKHVIGTKNIRSLERMPLLSTLIFNNTLGDHIKDLSGVEDLDDIHVIVLTNKTHEHLDGVLNSSTVNGNRVSVLSSSASPTNTTNRTNTERFSYQLYGNSQGNSMLDKIRSLLKDQNPNNIIIVQKTILLPQNTMISRSADIDETLSKHVSFIFHYNQSIPDIEIRSPSGVIYGMESDVCNLDFEFRIVKFHFDFIEAGSWKYNLRQSRPGRDSVEITVLCEHGNTQHDPIILRHSTKLNEDIRDAILLHIDATQGNHPMLGLNVIAKIEIPNSKVYQLKLLDNGAGIDITKNDGVYSRAFLLNGQTGVYHVNYEVYGKSGEAFKKEETFEVLAEETVPIKKKVSKIPLKHNMQRQVSGDSVIISHHGRDIPASDNIPPSRIVDFEAVRYIPYRNTVVLSWTAPGDDYDHGRLSSYQLFIGYDVKDIRLFLKFISTSEYNGEGHIRQENFPATKDATLKQVVLWRPKLVSKTLMFAVRGIDRRGNNGDISNVSTMLTS